MIYALAKGKMDISVLWINRCLSAIINNKFLKKFNIIFMVNIK